jgi:hypothetical protein
VTLPSAVAKSEHAFRQRGDEAADERDPAEGVGEAAAGLLQAAVDRGQAGSRALERAALEVDVDLDALVLQPLELELEAVELLDRARRSKTNGRSGLLFGEPLQPLCDLLNICLGAGDLDVDARGRLSAAEVAQLVRIVRTSLAVSSIPSARIARGRRVCWP